MTLQAFRVIMKLRKAEHFEGQLLYIDFEHHHIQGVITEPSEHFIKVSFSETEREMRSILRYLRKNGKIKGMDCYITLPHETRHLWQSMLSFLCSSVFLPILISFLTTIVTIDVWPALLRMLTSSR